MAIWPVVWHLTVRASNSLPRTRLSPCRSLPRRKRMEESSLATLRELFDPTAFDAAVQRLPYAEAAALLDHCGLLSLRLQQHVAALAEPVPDNSCRLLSLPPDVLVRIIALLPTVESLQQVGWHEVRFGAVLGARGARADPPHEVLVGHRLGLRGRGKEVP